MVAAATCASVVTAQPDRIVMVQAYDHETRLDYLLGSDPDVDAFRALWQSKTVLPVNSQEALWNAGLRIEFSSDSQTWVYDSRTGVATMLGKTGTPHYRLSDVAAFNALLRLKSR